MEVTDGLATYPSASGLIAGAVLRAARMSAHLSSRRLAARMGVVAATAKDWEQGTRPLASAPGDYLDQIVTALRDARADEAIVADLHVACWCDLTIDCIAQEPESPLTAAVLADELAQSDAFRELLGWATTGTIPARYSAYAPDEPLISAADVALFISNAQFLASVTDDVGIRSIALTLAAGAAA